MNPDLVALGVMASVAITLFACLAFIAEHRRKSILREMLEEAERVVHYGDPCPWDLR